MGYKFSPETSPFGVYRKFALLDRLPATLTPWAKLALSKALARLTGRRYDIRNIPMKLAPFFDFTTTVDIAGVRPFGQIPTIFDVLRDNGIRFTCINSGDLGLRYFWSVKSAARKLIALAEQVPPDTAFTYIYLHYLDNGAHRLGTTSDKFLREVSGVDSLVEQLVDRLEATLGDTETIIFSDHGMADARSFVNFDGLLKDRYLGERFVVTLDSTMVRIWYLDKTAEEYVRPKLAGLQYGRFLSAEDKERLRVNFRHSLYGEDIFLLDPPYNIFPNFISLLKPLAMHAYHPDLESQRAIAIFKGKTLDRAGIGGPEPIRMVDLMPTMVRALGLDVPPSCEGTPLI